MVDIAEDDSELYPADTSKRIALKGYVKGNEGNFNVEYYKTTSANIKPGMLLIRATGADGERSVTECGANSELGYGVAEWDKTQVATQDTAYASGDLIPVLPLHKNAGMIFQGYVSDTNGNWDADHYLDAGANGSFLTADLANKVYARNLYYVADTAEAAQLIVMYVAPGGMGG